MNRISVILAAAGFCLLGACKAQQPAPNTEQPTNSAAADPVEPIDAAAPLGTAVAGEEAKAVMHERHEGMEKIGKSAKTISRQLKSSSPDLAAIRAAAATIAELAPKTPGWFRPGTGPDVGKTGAKPEIWQSSADVAEKDLAFRQAAKAFDAAAASGDVTRIKASWSELGKTCKACHDKYRKEMHH
ncbi:MAG TPA: cytochrome c [Sphingomicrobium sp.]|nr:cytochrome c [Sphingomicrobium sp.]